MSKPLISVVAAPRETPSDLPDTDPSYIVRPSRFTERISFVSFWAIHVGCLAVVFTGVSLRAGVLALGLYCMHMFAITGGYHRYFSHRSYKTSRFFQFVLAVMGTMTVQKGPLWWAATHRHHHMYSDLPEDIHSPRQKGLWYSHVGWITSGDHVATDLRVIKDFASYPELLWIGKYHFIAPLLLSIFCLWFAGWSGLVAGMGFSLVAAWHCTFFINSLTHVFGSQRYETGEDSRNNLILALLTMGEGWHNNHHHYMHSVRQGFYWWEIDVTYYVLRGLAVFGIVWDLKLPPARVYLEADKALQAVSRAATKTPAPVSSVVRSDVERPATMAERA